VHDAVGIALHVGYSPDVAVDAAALLSAHDAPAPLGSGFVALSLWYVVVMLFPSAAA